MDFVQYWSEKTEINAGRFIAWLGTAASKFYSWRERYGKSNEHNAWFTGVTRRSIFGSPDHSCAASLQIES